MFAPEKPNKRNKMKFIIFFFAFLFAKGIYAQEETKKPIVIKEPPTYVYVDKNTQSIVTIPFKTFFKEWISQHFQYPEEAIKEGEEGLVKVVFEVDTQGKLIIKKTEGGTLRLRKAATQMFYSFPRLNPAKDENGDFASVTFSYPINFKID